ncbi:MAG: hypothetical protein LBH38_01580 [Holosporales bacterium]|nr:hypothetical protein [Holosporales bacterium]
MENSDDNDIALKILSESQQRLAARLKLFRLLSINAEEYPESSFEEGKEIIASYCLCEKVTFLTRDIPRAVPTPIIKFMVTTAMILLPTLIRGGHMVFELIEDKEMLTLQCTGQGGRIALNETVAAWFLGEKMLSSRTVLCFFAEMFANSCGAHLHLEQTPEKVTFLWTQRRDSFKTELNAVVAQQDRARDS